MTEFPERGYGGWAQWQKRAIRHGAADFQVKCHFCVGNEDCWNGCGLLVNGWMDRHEGGSDVSIPTLHEQAQHVRTGLVPDH